MMLPYKRILLKLSGESLSGTTKTGIKPEKVNEYAMQLKTTVDMGVEVGVVVGGGNIFRGLSSVSKGYDRVKADQMGMLATVINSIALTAGLHQLGVKTKILTATPMESFGEYFNKDKALYYLSEKTIVFLAGGTGNPYFTTDTSAALRAVEIGAEVMLKGTRVDGIYNVDPEKDIHAQKYTSITFDELYDKKLRIMDLTAVTLCKENNMPVIVFNMDVSGNLQQLLSGKNIGTKVV